MDFYYYDDDAFGWTSPLIHEHYDVEKNDPMRAELDHFIDLCLGKETQPRCSGKDALDTLKVINAILICNRCFKRRTCLKGVRQ